MVYDTFKQLQVYQDLHPEGIDTITQNDLEQISELLIQAAKYYCPEYTSLNPSPCKPDYT